MRKRNASASNARARNPLFVLSSVSEAYSRDHSLRVAVGERSGQEVQGPITPPGSPEAKNEAAAAGGMDAQANGLEEHQLVSSINRPVVDADGTGVIYGPRPMPSTATPYHHGTVQVNQSPGVPTLLAADEGQRSGNEPVGAGPPRIESIEDCSNLMMLAKAATLET